MHVPWCRRRCPYCAFYVEVDREVPWDRYVGAVLRERELRAGDFAGLAATVFLGGGTPSRLPGPELARLLGGLPRATDAEVTAETNPEDATDAWLDAALAAGVNRISLGVQTFNPDFGRLLNRAHTAPEARETARRVAAKGLRSWSVDVIFALPGQTLADLAVDLDAILDTGPPHVSLYGLTFEAGTPFARARDRGALSPPEDDRWREMYDLLVERLGAAGLYRYEVSNFARPGHESAHNRLYWTDRPYMGLGPSAHGYAPDGARWVNVRDAGRYLDAADPTEEREQPVGRDAAVDLLVSALRSVEGLDLGHLSRRTACSLPPAALATLAREGLLIVEPERIRLAAGGFPVADAVVSHLIGHLHEIRPGEAARDAASE